jgi:hypothetical protein
MTLTDALEHEWLALPSSQNSEAPVNRLGGDSQYLIKSWDSDSEDSVSFEAGEWSRPMTASGTNLASAINTTDGRAASVESDDSYSQKVENFHLNSSPGSGVGAKGRNARSAPHPLSLSTADLPSPPLKDEMMDLSASSMVENGDRNGGQEQEDGHARDKSPNEIHIAPRAETEPPGTATKRKALEIDLFASGSLSPPPQEDIELSSPLPSLDKPSTPQSEESSPFMSANGRGARRTTRSSAKSPTTTTAVTRGRKSMRLA